MSNSLQSHEPQHTRPPCSSPTPRVHSNPCPLSWWCHPTISSSVFPFSSCPQSFPASRSLQMSQLFVSCGQNIGVSASTSVLPMNTQDWSPLGWTGWISLQSKGFSRVFSNITVQKHHLWHSVFFIFQFSHPYMTTGKTIALTRWTFVDNVMFLLFNMLSRFVIAFLPRSKCLLISWLQSPSAVILEPRKIKSATVFTVSPSIYHEVVGLDAMILIFWMLSFKWTFSLCSFILIKSLFSSSFSAIRVVSSAYPRLLIFLLAILIPTCASSNPAFLMMYSQFSSVQSLSRVWLFVTPWITAYQASLCIITSQSLFKLMSIELVMPSSHLILCHPLLLLPPIPRSIRVFSNESSLCMRCTLHIS